MNISDFKLYYSGGVGNSAPASSVSGTIGNIITRNMTSVSNANPLSGIYIEDAVNINGVITLDILNTANVLQFTQDGVNSGTSNLSETLNKAVVLKTPASTKNSQLNIRYEGANLPNAITTANVTIATGGVDLFPDVSSQESLFGVADYRLVYIRNDHSTDSATLKSFGVDAPDVGQTFTVSIGDQVITTVNQTPNSTHEADPSTAPSYTTTKSVNVLMGPGDRFYFWIKRTVAASSTTTDPFCATSFKITADY